MKSIRFVSVIICLLILLVSCKENAQNTSENKADTQTTEDSILTLTNEQDEDTEITLGDYSVVCTASASKSFHDAAKSIVNYIREETGTLPERSDSIDAENEYEILIGMADASGKPSNDLDGYYFNIFKDGNRIYIDGDEGTIYTASEIFLEMLLEAENDVKAIKSYSGNKFDSLDGKLVVNKEESTEVDEGVTLTELSYTDKSGMPVKAFKLEISPESNARLTVGTANDTYEPAGTQTVLDQAKLYNNKGLNVLFAINADFFGEGGEPCGLLIRDGKLLHKNRGYSFFGVLKNGDYVIADKKTFRDYEPSDFDCACGASYSLLKDGNIIEDDIDVMYKREPRSGVGIKNDGTLIIAGVDGRQREYSRGITVYDFALMFKEWDCDRAINLDGGGSTTLACKNENGEINVINKPCVKVLRPVFDTILVVKD